MKNKKKSDLMIPIAVTIIASVIALIGLYFHEPWFDEAQAYLIGRDASLHDILFYLPHYEGHPPLWHLIMKFAIMFGPPYELTIKLVQFITFEAVILMIEFRSPLSKVAKLLLPLSYFIIYQYCVISRPYALLMLAALLCAAAFRTRREKPFRYVASLFFLCMCHSYGVALAGGIAVSDFAGEMVRNRSIKKPILEIFRNKKVLLSYSVLLAAALFIIAGITPREDTFAMSIDRAYPLPVLFLFCFLLIPSEAVVTSFSTDALFMQEETNTISELIATSLASLLIWALIFIICKKRRILAEMIIPYVFISIIMSVYARPHHFGLFIIYALYIIWIASDIEPIRLSEFTSPLVKGGLSDKFAKRIVCGAAVLVAAVNIYWDVFSYATDVAKPYDSAREAAEWIKENNIEDDEIMILWVDKDTNIYNDTTVAVNAYFSENLYYNMDSGVTYVTHIVPGDEEVKEDYEYMRKYGAPDYIMTAWPAAISVTIEPLGFDLKYVAEAYADTNYRPFKSKIEENHLFVMCTREKYKELYGKEYEVPTY